MATKRASGAKRGSAKRGGARKAGGKKLYAVSRGLKRYNFHDSQHTGSMAGYDKRGTTAKSTIVNIDPSVHFKGEKKIIHRRANTIRPASKPILGHSHVRAFKHS